MARLFTRLCPLALLGLACTWKYVSEPMPLYERAVPESGFYAAGGTGAVTGLVYSLHSWCESGWTWRHEYATDRFCGGSGTVRFGIGNRTVSVFGQATGEVTGWLEQSPRTKMPYPPSPYFPWECSAGLKGRIGKNTGLRYSLGRGAGEGELEEWRLDLFLLHDFTERWTAALGAGFRGLQASLAHHWRVSDCLTGHLTLSALLPNLAELPDDFSHHTAPVAASLGFGCSAASQAQPNQQ